jgi:lipooligosaccharide transport system permease protein
MKALTEENPDGDYILSADRRPLSALYARNARSVIERGFRVIKSQNWIILISGFFEPVFYLLSLGIGLGGLVGAVAGPGGAPISYAAYIAPALLAVSAMNGAIYDSTWNIFFKMHFGKLYQSMLYTSLGPFDIAVGEIFMALFRGFLYALGFTGVMGLMGLITTPWALLLVPTSVMVAFGFASFGMAITSYMKTFQQMDIITFVMLPMFLFSATFFPLSVYPEPVQWVIQALPLWHGVELMREISIGVFSAATWIHLAYYVVMILVGLAFTTRRLRALFLR